MALGRSGEDCAFPPRAEEGQAGTGVGGTGEKTATHHAHPPSSASVMPSEVLPKGLGAVGRVGAAGTVWTLDAAPSPGRSGLSAAVLTNGIISGPFGFREPYKSC